VGSGRLLRRAAQQARSDRDRELHPEGRLMDALMFLVHPRHGKRMSWTVFEQNLLLTEGWREVNAADYHVFQESP
jgi:hypothetical protein